MTSTKHPGVPVGLGGRTFIVPSLTLGVLQSNYAEIVEPRTDYLEAFEALLPILLTAVQRNYPGVTLGDLARWCDPSLLVELITAVHQASGLKPMPNDSVSRQGFDGAVDWAAIYAQAIRATGWTFEQCREQGAGEVFALLQHLSDQPPTHLVLAARYGLKSKAKGGPAPTQSDAAEVAQMLGGGVQSGLPERLARHREWAMGKGEKPPN